MNEDEDEKESAVEHVQIPSKLETLYPMYEGEW